MACAPGLADPDRFADASCPDVPAELLASRCATSACHDSFEPAAGLDLRSGGLGERLAGVDARTCGGRLLVDPRDFHDSFLLTRVSAEPRCDGEPIERMPLVGEPLSEAERACLQAWVERVAAEHVDRAPPRRDGGTRLDSGAGGDGGAAGDASARADAGDAG